MNTCKKCLVEKPLSAFAKSTSTKSGYQGTCRDCDNARKRASNQKVKTLDPEAWREKQNEYRARYKENNRDKIAEGDRRRNLKKKFGITPEQYDELLAQQGGVCAGCGCEPNGKKLAVDHDHSCCPGQRTCGKCLRGLLCGNCNTAIGLLKENPETIKRLLEYMR